MAIPVYLWLQDDGGAEIKGSVDVQKREGSIEVIAQDHRAPNARGLAGGIPSADSGALG